LIILLAGMPWHRAYLYWLELALQSQVPGVTLA
jgi:hypothetical protein